MTKITTIGGGSGAPIVIQSLILAGFGNLTAICTATDSGGRSGMVRTDERDKVISIGDLFNSFLAMIDPGQLKRENVRRFIELAEFTDGRKRNLGYTLFYGLLEKYDDDFLKVQRHMSDMLNLDLKGIVLPVSKEVTHLGFKTQSGQSYLGEHLLDYYQMSADEITEVWLEPKVVAGEDALKNITDTDVIIFAPGSLYGSVIANLLPTGINEAFQSTNAKKILLTNLVSDRNQTHAFTPESYLEVFQRYTGLEKPFDTVVIPSTTRKEFELTFPQVVDRYAKEHAHFLGWEETEYPKLHALGVDVIRKDVFSVTEKLGRIRHNPVKLSELWQEIL